jgi:acetylornithine deacetylase
MGHQGIATDMDFADGLKLARELIGLHPVYGSRAQVAAAATIATFMEARGWQDIAMPRYRAADLKEVSGYVPASALGGIYGADEQIEKINVLSRIENGKADRTLIINGHYDVDVITSPEDWREAGFWQSARLDGDKLYGRGATDMLGGLCMILAAASLFVRRQSNWNGRIIVMAVTDEEVGGNGTTQALRWLVENNWLDQVPFETECIIAEPTEGRVCTDSLGIAHCTVSIRRKAGHAGSSIHTQGVFELGLEALQAVQDSFRKLAQKYAGDCPEDAWVINFGRVTCGEDATIQPVNFVAEGVLLYPARLSDANLKMELGRLFRTLAPPDAVLRFGDFCFSGASFGETRLENVVARRDRAYLRIGNPLFKSPCDARLFSPFGIGCVICGPGSLGQAHSTDEFVKISDLRSYFTDIVSLIEDFFLS